MNHAKSVLWFIHSLCSYLFFLFNLLYQSSWRYLGGSCKVNINKNSYLIFIHQSSKPTKLHSSSISSAPLVVCQALGWKRAAAGTGPSLACELAALSGSGSRTWRPTGQMKVEDIYNQWPQHQYCEKQWKCQIA